MNRSTCLSTWQGKGSSGFFFYKPLLSTNLFSSFFWRNRGLSSRVDCKNKCGWSNEERVRSRVTMIQWRYRSASNLDYFCRIRTFRPVPEATNHDWASSRTQRGGQHCRPRNEFSTFPKIKSIREKKMKSEVKSNLKVKKGIFFSVNIGKCRFGVGRRWIGSVFS